MDTRDFEAGRKVDCPLLVIVGGQSHTSKFYSFEDAWSQYASNLKRCIALPCGHYPAEQDPEGTYRELDAFFSV
jgi:haloacetate dehalogenase